MEKVTERNTKAYILSAYKDLFEKYNELVKSRVPVKEQMREKETAELYEKVEGKSINKITDALKDFLEKASDIDDQIQHAELSFKDITKAVEEKERELKDLYGIEMGCHSFIALKEAHEAETLKFNEKKLEDEKAHNQTLARYELECEELADLFSKKEQELIYNHKRKNIELTHELDLERKKQALIISDEMKELENAKKEFQDEKEAFKVIKDEFEENSKAIIESEKEKREKAIEVIKKHYKYEKDIETARHESVIDKKDFEIDLLKTKVDELQGENRAIGCELKEAYVKLQELAKETVHSKGKDEIIEKLSSIAKKQNSTH
jgi:hypothetical protein